ncbi:hypothetical protein ACKI1I_46940, partial [Streptomyces turgidiscabies]|uniref:hypothetical protein n=1 Tax=Streptomyces turgidiscabies TaxID=85558 RepID=UPI0038F7F637
PQAAVVSPSESRQRATHGKPTVAIALLSATPMMRKGSIHSILMMARSSRVARVLLFALR